MAKTDKRTDENKFQAINVITNETVGWYPSQVAALVDADVQDIAVDVSYRPGRKKVSK